MRKQIFSVAVVVTLVLLASSTADAKKKPEEPVRESFVANVEDPSGAAPQLTIAIQDFSTDDEMQQLAQSYAHGEDSLRNAMDKSKKGYFTVGSSGTMHLRIIQDRPTSAGRRLLLVGDTPGAFSPQGTAQDTGPAPRMVLVGHAGYCVIQLEVDAQGNGKGIMYAGCKVGFNQHGQLAISLPTANSPLSVLPTAHQPYQVVNVQRVK